MQDTNTGLLEKLTEEEFELLEKSGFAQSKQVENPEPSWNIKVKNKIPIFKVGDEFDLHGGRFRVRKITRKDIVLRGIPSTEEANIKGANE